MYYVIVNYTFGRQAFRAATYEDAKSLKDKLYKAFADGGCWVSSDCISIDQK